jgi:hypothetical protein
MFMYVVDRDFGFAPNPFHGLCTLATCKPVIRRVAKEGDWIVGMGGSRLSATGRCIFAMKVYRSITFNQYWTDRLYLDKRPVRNGSKKMMVGDNIYHRTEGQWVQLNSHHSHPNGAPNMHNVRNDTQTDSVLVSDYFFYFGSAAVEIPAEILQAIKYKNGRSHRKFSLEAAQPIISFLQDNFAPNTLHGDPFDFEAASARYSAENNRVTKDA